MHYHRITDVSTINKEEIRQLSSEGKRVVIQFSEESYNVDFLQELNQFSLDFDGVFDVRFYGHYSSSFNGFYLKYLQDIPSLLIDCLTKAENLSELGNMKNLQALSLGVYEMDFPEVLGLSSLKSLKSLSLGETKKSNIDLAYLKNCKELTSFHTTGHAKNIEVLVGLPLLESLCLSQIKKNVNIDFVSNLSSLKFLRIILGGRDSITSIENRSITKLEIIRVRGLEDIGDIGRFPKLEELQVEDQIKIRQVKFGGNESLRYIKLLNCRTLEDISSIIYLPMLDHLRIFKTNIDYKSFINQNLPKSLKVLAFYTAKSKQDKVIKEDLDARGYLEYT